MNLGERMKDLDHEMFMRRAIELAAYVPAVPFGALIVDRRTGEIVAEGWNKSSANPTWHGEIDAINRLADSQAQFLGQAMGPFEREIGDGFSATPPFGGYVCKCNLLLYQGLGLFRHVLPCCGRCLIETIASLMIAGRSKLWAFGLTG